MAEPNRRKSNAGEEMTKKKTTKKKQPIRKGRKLNCTGITRIVRDRMFVLWQEDGVPIALRELERSHIELVLRHTGGNKKEAAQVLGIDRSTLYAKLKQYGID